MRLVDLLRLIADNLGRRKARVALTAIGVVIGTAAVVVLVSLGIGLQRNATEQLGGISDRRRSRPNPIRRRAHGRRSGGGCSPLRPGPTETMLITPKTLHDLAVGAAAVYLALPESGKVHVGQLGAHRQLASRNYLEPSTSRPGWGCVWRGTVVVGDGAADYYPRPRPGQTIPEPPDLLGQTVKMTLIKWTGEGEEVRKSLQVRVVGVLAETRDEPDWSIYMTLEDVTAFNQWATGGASQSRQVDGGVGRGRRRWWTCPRRSAMGYQAFSPMSYIQGISSFFLVLQVVFGGLGAIALLVAAIGIANTMAMAILERTREIGLMKAVGATNRDVLGVFLGEASGIGFLGGLGGTLLGWAGGQAINVVALAYLAGQAAESGGAPPPSVAVFTPLWLPIAALVFATLIGLLSGLYPALRAATLSPVDALKYECRVRTCSPQLAGRSVEGRHRAQIAPSAPTHSPDVPRHQGSRASP
jgi:putative ABC transport system permease protein